MNSRSIRSMGVATAALFGSSISLAIGGQTLAQSLPAESCTEQQLQTAQIRCFLDAAEAAKDPSICESADDPLVRLHCLSLYAQHSLDIRPCQRIEMGDGQTETFQDSCIGGVAIAGRDPKICGEIGRSEIRNGCYLMLVVQFEADPAICAQIQDPKVQALCRE